jgi:hypothetical protein
MTSMSNPRQRRGKCLVVATTIDICARFLNKETNKTHADIESRKMPRCRAIDIVIINIFSCSDQIPAFGEITVFGCRMHETQTGRHAQLKVSALCMYLKGVV